MSLQRHFAKLESTDSEVKTTGKNMDEHTFSLPPELVAQLRKMAGNASLPVYLILLANLKALIFKYLERDTISIGSPLPSQYQKGEPSVIIVSTKIDEAMSFKELLLKVRANTIEKYNMLQSNDSVAELKQKQGRKVHASDVALVFKPLHETFPCETLSDNRIVMVFFEHKNEISCSFRYDQSAYERFYIQQMGDHFKTILNIFLHQPDMAIYDAECLGIIEKNKIIHEFNANTASYDHNPTIAELFKAQVHKNPDKTAIAYQNSFLTYKELDAKAEVLCDVLIDKGVVPEVIVAVMLERSLELFVAIIAVLKAGGAYLPIDPEYPENRIHYMLENSRAKLFIARRRHSHYALSPGQYVNIEKLPGNAPMKYRQAVKAAPSNLAYLIYTSGTTGNPKGVMIEQKNIIAYVNAFQKEFNVTRDDAIIQQASFSFDHFVEEFYPLILSGGSVTAVDKNEFLNQKAFSEIIKRNRITILSLSPLMLNEINTWDDFGNIRLFLSGGDVLKKEYISNLLRKGAVYNTYGPTETTVCASYFRCEPDAGSRMYIGKPIANYRIYILDKHKTPVPIGIPGEIFISGAGVGRGYLGMEDRSRQYFMEDPFDPGSRMFRTGDMGKWVPDGNIRFLGRMDNQVKIRGYRIELEEIESLLLCHSAVRNAVMAVKEDNSKNRFICAYFISDKEIEKDELTKYLSKHLPHYMLPSFIIRIDRIPLTTNDFKIDKNSLPDPFQFTVRPAGFAKPQNNIETRFVEIWARTLETEAEKISVTDSFFEIGGTSLKTMVLLNELSNEFNIDLPVISIYKHQTIRKLAGIIQNHR